MRITPTIAQLEAFLQVAQTGSFSRAAAAAGVAQSTLSRTVRALEEALDLPLFHRDTRNVELTEASQRFRPQAARMLAELADVSGGRHGSLHIASAYSTPVSGCPSNKSPNSRYSPSTS